MSAVPIVKDKVILLRGDATQKGRRRNGLKVYVALGRLFLGTSAFYPFEWHQPLITQHSQKDLSNSLYHKNIWPPFLP